MARLSLSAFYPGSDVRGMNEHRARRYARYGAMGAVFCRDVEPPLAELKMLIQVAQAKGVDTRSAEAVYDDINGNLAYIPFVGDACAKHTAEVLAAANRLRTAIAAAGQQVPDPIRPDFVPSDNPGGSSGLVPGWLKFVAVAGVGAYLLHQVGVLKPKKG